MLKQQKRAMKDNAKKQQKQDMSKLFEAKKAKKQKAKPVQSKEDKELVKMVAQQKLMLKHQKKAMKHSKQATQDLGESDMGDLFQTKDDKKAAKVKKHVKSKAELETDQLVAQQKQMLKHQKKAMAKSKDAKNDLGESKDGDAMASLFKDKKNKKAAKAKKHVKSKAELETDKLVAQQKQMLKHQKKAIKH